MATVQPLLIIGIGNMLRRDDGVGIIFARKLAQHLRSASFRIHEHSGEGTSLMDLWRGFSRAAVIDAVALGGEPGTLYRFDAGMEKVPSDFFRYSSHAFGLAEAIELSRALEILPQRFLVFGIQGKDFSFGFGLSPEVDRAVDYYFPIVLEQFKEMAANEVVQTAERGGITHA